MKYVLDSKLRLFCSQNFYIPKYNSLFDLKTNSLVPYNVSEKFDLNHFCSVTQEEVDIIRDNYHKNEGVLIDPNDLEWVTKAHEEFSHLDLNDPSDLKIAMCYIYLLLKLVNLPTRVVSEHCKLLIRDIKALNSIPERKGYLDECLKEIFALLKNKIFWYSDDISICKKESMFIDTIAETIQAGEELNYDMIEGLYFDILNTGALRNTYEFNREKSLLSRGLDIDEQFDKLVNYNNYMISKIINETIDEKDFDNEESFKIKLIIPRLNKIAKLKLEEWKCE